MVPGRRAQVTTKAQARLMRSCRAAYPYRKTMYQPPALPQTPPADRAIPMRSGRSVRQGQRQAARYWRRRDALSPAIRHAHRRSSASPEVRFASRLVWQVAWPEETDPFRRRLDPSWTNPRHPSLRIGPGKCCLRPCHPGRVDTSNDAGCRVRCDSTSVCLVATGPSVPSGIHRPPLLRAGLRSG